MSFVYDSPKKFVYPVEDLSICPVENEKVTYESTDDLKIDKNEDISNHSPKDDTSCSSTLSYRSEISSSGSSIGYEDYRLHNHSTQANSTKWVLSKLFSWNKNKAFQPVSSLSNGNNNTPSKYIDKTAGTTAFLIQHSRPSNLPAKNADEEELHRKQYNAILRAARKREIREEKERQLQRELQFKEEERLAEETNVWNLCILPQFEYYRHTKKVHELWWRGLPSSVRGKVWRRAVDNYLNITPQLYNSCRDKSISNPSNDSLIAIRLDVSRTFPHLCVFQEGGPLFDSLQGVLAAYSAYRPDVGYVQGMSFIGAVLSLNMESVDAFICFANLLNRPCHKAAFMLDQDKMNMYYKVYSSALAHQLPKIFSHFSTTGLSPDFYLLDWLYTIYAKAMPLDVACRVWDIFIRDGEEFLFRTALGVLNLYQKELLEMDFIHGAQFLTRLPENLQGDALFDSISQMSTTIGRVTFQQLLVEIEAL